MKARIPNSAKLTKKQLQAPESNTSKYVNANKKRILRQSLKFGSKRCLAVINGISRLSAEHDQDEIFWEHLDRVIVDEMKLDFERD